MKGIIAAWMLRIRAEASILAADQLAARRIVIARRRGSWRLLRRSRVSPICQLASHTAQAATQPGIQTRLAQQMSCVEGELSFDELATAQGLSGLRFRRAGVATLCLTSSLKRVADLSVEPVYCQLPADVKTIYSIIVFVCFFNGIISLIFFIGMHAGYAHYCKVFSLK